MPYFKEGSSRPTPERQPEKSVKMPTREQMTEKLQVGKFLGVSSQTDKFYNRFIESVADSTKVGIGLNLAWELAKYDTLQGYPPVIEALVDMGYDDVIDAVTPDPDVANRAKELRRELLEQLRREQEGNK